MGDSEEDLNENLSSGQGNARRLMEGLYGVDEYYSDEVKFLLEPENRQLLDEGDFDALFENACNTGCAVGLGVILVRLGICERDDIYQYMPGLEDLREYDGRCLVDLLDWQDFGKSGKHEYYYIFYYGDVDTNCSHVGPLHADTDEDLAKALIAYFALEDDGNGVDDVVEVISALSKGKKIGAYWKYVSEGSLHTSNNFGYVIKEDGKIIEDCVMWEEEVGPDEYEDVYGEGAAKTSGLDFYEWGDYWADDDDEDDDDEDDDEDEDDEDLDESLKAPLKESLTDELNKLRKVLESNGFTFVESQPDRKQVIFKDSSGNEFCAQLAETTLKLKNKSILVKVDKSEIQEDKPVYQYKTMPGVALSKEYIADGAKAARFINDLLKSN